MEFIVMGLLGFFGLAIVDNARVARERKERIREAYKFEVPPVHGTRKFASDKQLKKAGLI
jgi:hypothetical protein